MVQFVSKLFIPLIFITVSYTTLAKEMNDDDAKLSLIASVCAYQLGENITAKDSDKKNIETCFDGYGYKVDYLASYIAASRLGIDAFYWAKTKENDKLILAFRGTLPPPNKFSDIDDYFELTQIKYDWLNNTDIKFTEENRHKGFSNSWSRLKEKLDNIGDIEDYLHNRLNFIEIQNDTNTEKATYQNIKKIQLKTIQEELNENEKILLITGHSKGAALATLAALDIAEKRVSSLHTRANNIYLYTFEGPRVFNFEGAKKYAEIMSRNHWRFEYGNDIVPHLPPGGELSDSQRNIIRVIGYLVGFDIKNIEYTHVGKLKYRRNNENALPTESDENKLKSERLENLGKAVQLDIDSKNLKNKAWPLFASLIPKSFSEIQGVIFGNPSSASLASSKENTAAAQLVYEISKSIKIGNTTLVSDHSLTHWIEHFKLTERPYSNQQ